MKSRILFIITAICVMAAALLFRGLEQEIEPNRYHQHLEQPSEEALGPCDVCGGTASLCTHLPIICIETGGQKIPGAAILDNEYNVTGYELGLNGEEEILATVMTMDAEESWHHLEDTPTHSSMANIRYRGNTSRSFDKLGYSIELVREDGLTNRNLPLLGMDSDNEWALHGPFLDKTLIRNYMFMNISAQIMGDAPDVRFCELIVDGKYQGVYVLMETISEGEGRTDLTDFEPGDPACSYIVRIGGNLNPEKTIDNFTYYTYRMEAADGEGKQIEIIYPSRMEQTQQVKDYVCADFSEAERLLFSAHMHDGSRQWTDWMDVDSFVNYYILQEYLMVSDVFTESTYFFRDVRGKIHIGPVWDYNSVMDNFVRPVARDEFLLSQRGWYAQLMSDRDFVERVISRYRSLRKNVLSDEALCAYVDETVAWLGSAVDRNFEVWGYSFDITQLSRVEYRHPSLNFIAELQKTDPEHAAILIDEETIKLNPTSHEEAVRWLKECIEDRSTFLDNHIDSLRQYCSESKYANKVLY